MQFGEQHSQIQESANGAISLEQVNVFVNGISVKICELDSLLTIESIFGMTGMRFILNGRLLCPALSLKFNGVKDGDSIIAIPSSVNLANNPNRSFSNNRNGKFRVQKLKERFDRNWANKFIDPDSVFEQLRDAADPDTARESARLSDLFRIKIENNAASYRKVCNKFIFDHNAICECEKKSVTVIPEKSFSPSTEFLPEMWIHGTSAPNNGTTRTSVC